MTPTMFNHLLTLTAEEFGLTTHQILGPGKTVDICKGRFALSWVLRDAFKLHPEQIGNWMAGRTRTAILASLGQASNWRETELDFRRQTDRLREKALALTQKESV